MKKLAVVFLICFLFYLPANALDEKQDKNIISAKGNASIDVKPDVATVMIAIETEARKLDDAISENNSISDKINTNLKKILGQNDKIKTTNFQVNPVYSYDKGAISRKREITGYRVSNQVQVKTDDINKLGEILETALSNGANRISGLSYDIDDPQKICQGLLKKAAENARTEAETLSQALGVKITGISKVSSSCNDRKVRPYITKAFGMAESAPAPPLEAGENTVSAEVFVDFIIE